MTIKRGLLLLLVGSVLIGPQLAPAQPPRSALVEGKDVAGRRWAVLIGVDQYRRLSRLRYCGNDVRAAGEQLVASGFPRDRVVVIHDKAEVVDFEPFKRNIEEQIRLVLGSAREQDLVLLSFSGHGVRVGGQAYLCPYDADPSDTSTLIPLDDVFRALEECPAALKLFIVDACQNDAAPPGVRSGIAADSARDFAKSLEDVRPPKGTLLLTSCAPGEQSREADEFKHGVFMHFMLEGLSGRADNNRNGAVMLSELFAYASDRTQDYVRLTHRALQRPRLRGDIVDFPVVQAIEPAEIVNSIGMKLVLIPAGQIEMASEGGEAHSPRRIVVDRPFYMAAHEVTVGQFRRFVEATGHVTEAERDEGWGDVGEGVPRLGNQYSWRNPGFPQTDEHPVVNVSHNDAVAFARWLGGVEGRTARLPSEAQWLYACLAGGAEASAAGNASTQNMREANLCDASRQRAKRQDLAAAPWDDGAIFAAPVGRYRANPLGLLDMIGNVREWCDDALVSKASGSPEEPDTRGRCAVRGMSFAEYASDAATPPGRDRAVYSPDIRYFDLGFRIVEELK